MELERQYIERRDFPPARRGYDPDEVDRHLRQVAEAVEQLRAARPAAQSVSGLAAERVQAIVEAAESSAREIEERAREDAQRARAEAERSAGETRARADAEAAEHLRRAEEVAGRLAARAEQLDQQVNQLLEQLRDAAGGVVEALRGGAQALQGELTAMHAELGSVRARPQAPLDAGPEEDDPLGAGPLELPGGDPAEPEPDVSGLDLGAPEPDATLEHALPVEALPAEPAAQAAAPGERPSEGARLIALNMALSGTPREETARYLRENFDLGDQDELLDEVYAKAGG